MADVTDTLGAEKVLKPYTRDPGRGGTAFRRRLGLGFFFLFCWFWGLTFAFLAPYLLLFFAFPLAVLLALCIWALPDETPAPLKAMNWFFFAYLVGKIMWPDYLAIDTSVLPWISVARLTSLPLTILFLVSLSVSRDFRQDISSVWRASPTIFRLLVAFNVLQILSILLSKHIAFSLDKLYNDEITWIAMFFVGCWCFNKRGSAEHWSNLFWLMTIPISLIATLEYFHGRVLWAGHIPAILKIQDQELDGILRGGMRAYTGRYRSLSTFTTPLALSEYLALAAPFAIHVLMNAEFSRRLRWAAGAAVPLIMLGIWLTNARLGAIGFLAGGVIYGLAWALHQRRWRPRNVFADLVTLSYPVLFLGLVSATFLVGKLRRITWGGGEMAMSNEGRRQQLLAAIPILEKNPVGHGVAMAAETLGFREPSGLLTIDSYFLSILLEYGVVGFLIYYGMFVLGGARAIKTVMAVPPERRELSILLPAGTSLFVYVIIKSVFSQEGNNSLAFIVLGLVCALIHRALAERKSTAPNIAASLGPDPQARALQAGGPRRPRRPATHPANP